jgi:hypothetical protein
MDYKAMARAIREERRALWVQCGKPDTKHKRNPFCAAWRPWHDLNAEERGDWVLYDRDYWFGAFGVVILRDIRATTPSTRP